jgi:hypothetical protein
MALDQVSVSVRDKLVAAQGMIAHSRKMIQLYDVPELDVMIEHYGYDLDYGQMKQIFRDQVGFPSMVKLVDELQASLVRGVQQGLF